MKPALRATWAAATLATGLAMAMLSACAHRWSGHTGPDAMPRAAASAPAAPPLRIVQATPTPSGAVGRFVLCSGAACPAVTPKTLATAQNAAPQSTAETAPDDSAEMPAAAAPPAGGDIAVVVRFRFAESTLTPRAKALLDAAANEAAATGKTRRLLIVGRTDSVGSQATNDALALARARAVRDHLRTRLKAWPATVDIEAAGACCYATGNDTAQGRLENRRVEVTLSADEPEGAL